MNRYITKNGITVREFTKERYNLMTMYEQAYAKHGYCAIDSEPTDPAYAALHKWYHGESGEQCCVTKLKRLGLIGEDTFREVNLNNMPIMPGYKRTPSQWTTNTIKER